LARPPHTTISNKRDGGVLFLIKSANFIFYAIVSNRNQREGVRMKRHVIVLLAVIMAGCATWGDLNPGWADGAASTYGSVRVDIIHWEKVGRGVGLIFLCDDGVLVTELWGDSSGGTDDNRVSRVALPEESVTCNLSED
jgi:hypothetical protein